jgi:Na+/H+-dicarboxylate symporter
LRPHVPPTDHEALFADCGAGVTANQNGTALFEGVTVLFLAQFFRVDLSLWQQFTVVLICILGGIGTAGVPAGSLPVVAMILGMVGVPPEGIGWCSASTGCSTCAAPP